MKIETENATYVITSVGKTKTVSFQKLNKKKTNYKIPSYVIVEGTKYKVTQIASKAFKGNKKIKKIKKITIGSYVKKIGKEAFSDCTKLKKVTIGKNVTTIGKKAFCGCKKLKAITIKTAKLKTVGKNAFKGIHKKATIKVPKKKYSKYSKLLQGKGQKKTVKIKKNIIG